MAVKVDITWCLHYSLAHWREIISITRFALHERVLAVRIFAIEYTEYMRQRCNSANQTRWHVVVVELHTKWSHASGDSLNIDYCYESFDVRFKHKNKTQISVHTWLISIKRIAPHKVGFCEQTRKKLIRLLGPLRPRLLHSKIQGHTVKYETWFLMF